MWFNIVEENLMVGYVCVQITQNLVIKIALVKLCNSRRCISGRI